MTAFPQQDQTAAGLIFQGRVQGVGFRYTTHSLSRQFDVAGYVRNLKDGTVELRAQGQSQEIDRFVMAIRKHFEGQITSVQRDTVAPDSNLKGFTIR